MSNRLRLLFLIGACALMCAGMGGARAAEQSVWIALTEQGGGYAETAEAIRTELDRSGNVEVVVKPWQEFLSMSPPPRLVVAVGLGALRGLADVRLRAPLLATLVPRAGYAAVAVMLTQATSGHSAVWLDQPATRQIALVRAALPGRGRIGALFGLESRLVEFEFERAVTAAKDLSLVSGHVSATDQLPSALQRVTEEADILVALPDPMVYNGATIQNILTAAYRRRIPLLGFSPAYVKAGALLALYSTPVQVGTQAGEVARAVLAGRPLPPAQGPRRFTIEVNANVARSLGLHLDNADAARLAEQIRQREGAP